MDLDETRDVALSGRDLMMLRAGLSAYLAAFKVHREIDGGASHPEDQWQQLQRQVGELIWRLEKAGVESGTRLIHSDEAVEPGSSVREASAEGIDPD